MLNNGKKPEAKEEAKEASPVLIPAPPLRAETPRLLRAALEMSQRSSGLKGALAKVREKSNKSRISLQVNMDSAWSVSAESAELLHSFPQSFS